MRDCSNHSQRPAPLAHPITVSELSKARSTAFDLVADALTRARICDELGLSDVLDFRFKGEIQPRAKESWRIDARLTASLSQPCVVTLEPVAEKVDEQITRDFVPETQVMSSDQIDVVMDEDDEPDILGDVIDPGLIALEALALALEPYPRKPGVEHETLSVTEPGIAPLTDENIKPFAGLAVLKAKMSGDEP